MWHNMFAPGARVGQVIGGGQGQTTVIGGGQGQTTVIERLR